MYLQTGKLTVSQKIKVDVLPPILAVMLPWGILALVAAAVLLLPYYAEPLFMWFYTWLVVPLSNVLP